MVTLTDVLTDMRDLRENLTRAGLRIEVLEERARADAGVLRQVEAQSLVFQNRITKLHVENEQARALLHRAVTWIDRVIVQTEGIAQELIEQAEDLARDITAEEQRERA